jgi:uncharacterized iron-regulated membrane protein
LKARGAGGFPGGPSLARRLSETAMLLIEIVPLLLLPLVVISGLYLTALRNQGWRGGK